MFTNTYLPHVGGVARSVSAFAEDLKEAGHRVLIIAPTYPGGDSDEEDESGGVLRLPAIQHFKGSDFSLRIPLPFYIDVKIDEFQPDIIHSHHPYLLGDSALRAARKRSLPLIFTHHTLYEEYTHYVTVDSVSMKNFAIALSTEYANLCTRVIAPSESIKELIQKRGVKTETNVIPTGVDLPFFEKGNGKSFRRNWGISEDAFLIGHLGRLALEKNLGFLVESIVKVLQEASRAFFLVAGQGPLGQEVVDVFSQKGLQERLVMTGKQTGTDLAEVYNAMDLFVFTSKSETQGMVLAEAMASGVPVIALDASGAREVVIDKKNGRLLDGDASESCFARAVLKVAAGKEPLTTWQKNARETGWAFGRKKSAEKLCRLYESAAEQAPYRIKKSLLDPWEAIQTEWDLLAEKARAMAGAVTENVKERSF